MMTLLCLLVIGGVVVACVKAYCATRLLEKNPEAWEKLQQAEEEKRRRQQEALGNAILSGSRTVRGWQGKKKEP